MKLGFNIIIIFTFAIHAFCTFPITEDRLVLPPPIPGQGFQPVLTSNQQFPVPPPDDENGPFLRPPIGPPQRPPVDENAGPNIKPPFYPFPLPDGSNNRPVEEAEGKTEAPEPRPTFVPIPLPTNKPIWMPIYDPLAPRLPEVRTTTEYVPTPDYDRVFNIFNYEKNEPKRIRLYSSS